MKNHPRLAGLLLFVSVVSTATSAGAAASGIH